MSELLRHQQRLLLASVKLCIRHARKKPWKAVHELDVAIVLCRTLVESLR